MVKIGAMNKPERDKYFTAENKAYQSLLSKGYSPQGVDNKFEKVVVFKIKNQHTNSESKEIYCFEDWIEADKNLK
ncbi:MAG: hypothetical protein RR415_10115 [Ruthenibacterium sp.]